MDLVAVTTRRIPSRIHSGQAEVFRELLACKPAAVTHIYGNKAASSIP